LKPTKTHKEFCKGSLLLLTTLFLLTVALLLGSFWGVLRINIRSAQIRENELRAYYAAQGGVSEVIDELRQGHHWNVTGGLGPQWVHASGATFYKSTIAPTPLTSYDYPVTISVTLAGDPDVEKTQVTSVGSIKGTDDQVYSRTVVVSIVKTLSGEVALITGSE